MRLLIISHVLCLCKISVLVTLWLRLKIQEKSRGLWLRSQFKKKKIHRFTNSKVRSLVTIREVTCDCDVTDVTSWCHRCVTSLSHMCDVPHICDVWHTSQMCVTHYTCVTHHRCVAHHRCVTHHSTSQMCNTTQMCGTSQMCDTSQMCNTLQMCGKSKKCTDVWHITEMSQIRRCDRLRQSQGPHDRYSCGQLSKKPPWSDRFRCAIAYWAMWHDRHHICDCITSDCVDVITSVTV